MTCYHYTLSIDDAYFTLTASGDLQLAQRLDLESLGTTTLTVDVTVSDAVAHTVTETVTMTVLDVNDNSPYCDQKVYFHTLEENSAGSYRHA